MKKTIISISVLLSACASTPEKGSKVSPLGETKASYSEKTVAVNLGSFKPSSNCPKDTKFNGMDWRKMVSLANACVKAKDWRKVELLGSELGISAHLTPWGPYFLSLAAESRKDYPRAVWMLELALKKAPN